MMGPTTLLLILGKLGGGDAILAEFFPDLFGSDNRNAKGIEGANTLRDVVTGSDNRLPDVENN